MLSVSLCMFVLCSGEADDFFFDDKCTTRLDNPGLQSFHKVHISFVTTTTTTRTPTSYTFLNWHCPWLVEIQVNRGLFLLTGDLIGCGQFAPP